MDTMAVRAMMAGLQNSWQKAEITQAMFLAPFHNATSPRTQSNVVSWAPPKDSCN